MSERFLSGTKNPNKQRKELHLNSELAYWSQYYVFNSDSMNANDPSVAFNLYIIKGFLKRF